MKYNELAENFNENRLKEKKDFLKKHLTKEKFNKVEKEVEKFNKKFGYNIVDYEDVLFTYYFEGFVDYKGWNDWVCSEKDNKKAKQFIISLCKSLHG